MKKQLALWRDSFIKTTINNNNMLNQDPAKSKAIVLDVSPYFTYERFWQIAKGETEYSEYALCSGMNYDPRYHPIVWHAEAPRADAKNTNILDEIIKVGYKAIVQKGENPICLTFGKLKWKVGVSAKSKLAAGLTAEEGEDENAPIKYVDVYTPILFIPVKINRNGIQYWLKAADEEGMINPALILKYKQQGNPDFPLPPCGQWLDESFNIKKYFDELEELFGDRENTSFDKNYVGIDVFEYDRMCMYRDVARHMPELEAHPVVRAMFGLQNCNGTGAPVQSLDELDPSKVFPILDTNSSQSDVIQKFKNGASFVLEGPPGTGKTQTIVNMISEALMANKSVLFVSGKMSALNTVVKKMQMPGTNLHNRCLLIGGEDENGLQTNSGITDVCGRLSAAYHAERCVFDRDAYEENMSKLKTARTLLLGYNKEFYDTNNSLGTSIYDLIGRILLLGYNENHVKPVVFPETFLEILDRKTLQEYTDRIGAVQSLICDIIKRSGSVREDVWFGCRKENIDVAFENEVRNYVSSIGSSLKQIDDIFKDIKASGTDKISVIVDELMSCPLDSIGAVMNESLIPDLGQLYINGKDLGRMKAEIRAEMERADTYKRAAESYYDNSFGEAEIDFNEALSLLEGTKSCADYEVANVSKECKKLRFLKNNVNFRFDDELEDGAESSNVYKQLIELIDEYVKGNSEYEKLNEELQQSYADSIFTYDYKSLLMKFRQDWSGYVLKAQQTAEGERFALPFFVNLDFQNKIKGLKAHCKDVANTEFNVKTVYLTLEKLESRNLLDKRLAEIKEIFARKGLEGIAHSETALGNLKEMLAEYLEMKAEFQMHNFLEREMSFADYLNGRLGLFENVEKVVMGLKLKTNLLVKDLAQHIANGKLVKENNARIASNSALTDLMKSIEKNVNTDWESIYAILSIVEKAKKVISNENRSLQEDFEIFVDVVRKLNQNSMYNVISGLLSKYREFYNNEEWFDPAVTKDKYKAENMTYANLSSWHKAISDFDHLTAYVQYRACVNGLDVYGKKFFAWYAEAGRAEHPLEKMRDYYESCILYAYYMHLVEKSHYVSRLSGMDGVTTVKQISDTYAAADEKVIEFNRYLLDCKLHNRVSRSQSVSNNKHNYLAAVQSGQGVSVRRLFKKHAESIKELAPCIMMSVYSVSKLLELSQYTFDVVIFDEASQIPAEDALTSILRSKGQVVISGDPKQMPAISYFAEKGDEVQMNMDESDNVVYCDSIIDFIAHSNSTLSYEKLNMHYRSNHESLIKYSNEHKNLYNGTLVTFPSPKARTKDFGLWNYYVPEMFPETVITGGHGRNYSEATVVVNLLKEHFAKYPLPKTAEEKDAYKHSVGVIVFGKEQKKEIEGLMEKDATLKALVGLNEPKLFFMETADNIQGDEMSSMILSLTYGRDPEGKISGHWGHLNQTAVALRKFNVAVTRAKDNLKFVHSVRANDIAKSGLEYVAEYLRQFESFSSVPFENHTEFNTKFVEAIGRICEEIVGKERVVYNYGESTRSYRVPISILSKDGQSVALGIMCEENRGLYANGQGFSVREYGRTCQIILKAHGWSNLYETYAIQWMRNYKIEKEKLIEKLKEVL